MSILLVVFQLYTTAAGALVALVQRSVHLGFVLALCFILKPPTKKGKGQGDGSVPIYDVIFAVLSLAACAYVAIHSEEFAWTPLKWYGPVDVFFAVALVLLVLEAARRSVGWTFPIMAAVLILYAYYGEFFPGIWGHKRFSLSLIFQTYYHTSNGVWGTMVSISATTLAMFGIFGAVLGQTGGSETFVKMGQKLTGRYTGGTAKMSLISDALFGMISGSAMANVVGTGVFTIPMMKKSGFPPKWAAAFEAVGSTGGQIMPPIMGSAAFIMAQLIAMPYISIAKAAVIPALLYYVGAFVAIHGVASRYHVLGTDEKVSITAREYINIFFPLGIFIFWLVRGFSATNSAFYASIAAVVVCAITDLATKKKPVEVAKDTGRMVYNSAIKGASSIVDMAVLLAGAQLSITLISMTGVGVKLADVIVSVGQDSLFLCLVLSMLVCIILGMGLPTTAAYVLGASVLAPALTTLGMSQFIAHMFIFFFSTMATITPPVCAAVFLASGLAGSKWFETGVAAVLIALPAFIVPYTFAYNPALLMDGTLGAILIAVATAVIGVVMLEVAVAGFWKHRIALPLRLMFAAAGFLMILPNSLTSVIGLAAGGAALVIDLISQRARPAAQ